MPQVKSKKVQKSLKKPYVPRKKRSGAAAALLDTLVELAARGFRAAEIAPQINRTQATVQSYMADHRERIAERAREIGEEVRAKSRDYMLQAAEKYAERFLQMGQQGTDEIVIKAAPFVIGPPGGSGVNVNVHAHAQAGAAAGTNGHGNGGNGGSLAHAAIVQALAPVPKALDADLAEAHVIEAAPLEPLNPDKVDRSQPSRVVQTGSPKTIQEALAVDLVRQERERIFAEASPYERPPSLPPVTLKDREGGESSA